MIGGLVARGLLAGTAAGLLAGAFLLAVGEPLMEQALVLEAHGGAEVLGRDVQRGGLLAATTLYGLGVGGLFAIAFALIGPHLRTGTTWERAVRLSGAAFVGGWLVPFLKYPANPPGVGEAADAGGRAAAYLGLVAMSLLLVGLAYLAGRALEDRGLPASRRLPLVAGAYVLAVAVAYAVLPDPPDAGALPASLVWDLRLASLGGQAMLWATLGAAFGALVQRAAQQPPGVVGPRSW